MKKQVLLLLMLTVAASAYSQRIDQYTASNGITYHEGDTIMLATGSDPNGNFLYLQRGGMGMSTDVEENKIPRTYANTAVVVKKIRKNRIRGVEKTVFTVGGNVFNDWLYIEEAIAACEIKDCNNPQVTESKEGSLDKLKKLKELLDLGAITQDEYDQQKGKILENL